MKQYKFLNKHTWPHLKVLKNNLSMLENIWCDRSIRETSWLLNEGMCVLLFDVFKHLLLRKTDVLKTCRKSKFLGKKIWRNALALKSKKVQGIFGETFILALFSSSVFRLQKPSLRFLLSCSVREIKDFYQSSLGNELDFRDIMNASPKILPKN